jgi:PhnB protein
MPENDSNSPLMPHVCVRDAAAAIDFYRKAFNARELMRHLAPDGKRIMHSNLSILGGTLLLNDDFPEFMGGKRSTPEAFGGSPIVLHLQVEDADAIYNQAVAAGAQVKMPLADQFWGDRYGQIVDPFGLTWSIGAKIREVSSEELDQAAKAQFS